MFRAKYFRLTFAVMLSVFAVIAIAVPYRDAAAQGSEPIPLIVEAAVAGELNAQTPSVTYSFNVFESLRMSVVFDLQESTAEPTLMVYDQDGSTVLAGSNGAANEGLIVSFPAEGEYTLTLSIPEGETASYRLMIDADPPLPLNAFVGQSYLVAGLSTTCAENTPTAYFSPTEDLNVCFVMDLIEDPIELTMQWWSPSGAIVIEENATFEQAHNLQAYLTGIVYAEQAWETGWWQVHFLIDGELAHIQWVPVLEAQE